MKGYIYVIKSESAGLAYYGSTKKTLDKRLSAHRSDKRAYEKKKKIYCTSFVVLEHEDHKIELMVEVEVSTKKELHELEGFYIENNHCVNNNTPGRTREEITRAYREANRDEINKKHTCECGGKYTHTHKARHFKTPNHINFVNNKP
jgi:predicted GIY-YIG superfamily endonuclease